MASNNRLVASLLQAGCNLAVIAAQREGPLRGGRSLDDPCFGVLASSLANVACFALGCPS